MGVQAEVPSRERRGSPQDEVGAASVKRFKPSPMSSEEENSSGSSGLKIRLSRYPESSRAVKQESPEEVSVKNCEVRVSPLGSVKVEASPVYELTTSMSSSEIIRYCERVGPGSGPISTSVQADQAVVAELVQDLLPDLSVQDLVGAVVILEQERKIQGIDGRHEIPDGPGG